MPFVSSVRGSYGPQSERLKSILPSAPGLSSSNPAQSPYEMLRFIEENKRSFGTQANLTDGTYWFVNNGYNSGNPFQAYANFNIDNQRGYIILNGLVRTNSATNDWNFGGTAATSSSGTPGYNTNFYMPSATILNGWSGDSHSRFVVGMTNRTNSSIATATDARWFVMNVSPSSAKSIFDNAPGTGQYQGNIVNSSSGTTGPFYWSTSHGNSIYQMSRNSNTVNSQLWMENRVGGTDSNHSWIVFGNNSGTYYVGNAPYTNRWLFMGFSPNNSRL